MKITEKQLAAIDFISRNPDASVEAISAAAGASTSTDNSARFLARLLDSGLVELVITAKATDAIASEA